MNFSKMFIGLGIVSSLALATAAFAENSQYSDMHNSGQSANMRCCPNMGAGETMKFDNMNHTENKQQRMDSYRVEHNTFNDKYLIDGRSS